MSLQLLNDFILDIKCNSIQTTIPIAPVIPDLSISINKLDAALQNQINNPTLTIPDNSILNVKLVDKTIENTKIKNDTIINTLIANDAVTTTKIIDNSITNLKLQGNSVTTTKILDNTITALKLQGNCVITSKILDNNVTNAKLFTKTVDNTKIKDGTIISSLLDSNLTVSNDLTVNNRLTTVKLTINNGTGTYLTRGTATLVSGTVTVTTSAATTTSIILLQYNNVVTINHLSALYVIKAVGSFTINSKDGSDDNNVDWIIINPA